MENNSVVVILKGLLARRYENCFVTENLLFAESIEQDFSWSFTCKISSEFQALLMEREKLSPSFVCAHSLPKLPNLGHSSTASASACNREQGGF